MPDQHRHLVDTAGEVLLHVSGIHEGNEGPYERQPGHHEDGTADARRSTGVHVRKHNAILKIMPNMPPG